MAKLLVTGGAGFVGRSLADHFRDHDVFLTDVKPVADWTGFIDCDITDPVAVERMLKEFRPAAVVHCAGIKDVRLCEQNPALAEKVNADATRNIARASALVGAKLIYISTDLVFPSDRGNYRETDPVGSPLVYGRTKALGEIYAREAGEHTAICRSAGIYGKRSPLLHWLAGQLREGKSVECFTDVYNTPTLLDSLGEMIDAVISRNLNGTFHTVGRERVNRFEFFRSFADAFGYDRGLLKPQTLGARRSELMLMPDSSLLSEASVARLDLPALSLSEGLARLRAAGAFQ